MKREMKLIVLLAVLALLAGAAALVSRQNQEPEETDPVIFAVAADTVEALEWNYGEERLAFHKDGDTWQYSADSAFPLDISRLEDMVETVSQIVSYNTLREPQEAAEYGLDAPACTVTVTSAGSAYTLKIGNETVADSMRYLSTGDALVHMVDEGLYETFCCGLYDLVAKDEIPAMTEVTAVTVQGEKSLTLSLEEAEEESSWYAVAGEEKILLDTELTEAFISLATELTWDSCVCYNATDDLLLQYGLGANAATVTVTYAEGETFALELGSLLEDKSYARVAGSELVYLINSSTASTLRNTDYTALLTPAEE